MSDMISSTTVGSMPDATSAAYKNCKQLIPSFALHEIDNLNPDVDSTCIVIGGIQLKLSWFIRQPNVLQNMVSNAYNKRQTLSKADHIFP